MSDYIPTWTYSSIMKYVYLTSGMKSDGDFHYGLFDCNKGINWDDYFIIACVGETFIAKDGSQKNRQKYGFESRAKLLTEHTKQHLLGKVPAVFEVIPDKSQKIYFDLDLKYSEHPGIQDAISMDDITIDLVSCIPAKFKTCLVWDSPDPANDKFSRHLICPDTYAGGADIMKQMYVQTLINFDREYPIYREIFERHNIVMENFIDSSVYGKNQRFRMPWSSKYNTNRPKLFKGYIDNTDHGIYFIDNKTYYKQYEEEDRFTTDRRLLELSMISHIIGNETAYVPEITVTKHITKFETFDLAKSEVSNIRKMISAAYPNKFNICDVNDNIICLNHRRSGGYTCKSCNRIHEHERPYVFVVQNDSYPVFFNCRRGGKSICIGQLTPSDQNIDNVKNTPPTNEYSANVKGLGYNNLTLTEQSAFILKKLKIQKCNRWLDSIDLDEYESYVNNWVEAYDIKKYNTLMIKAPMGSGKTYQLIKLLVDNPDMSVVIMSSRISFARSINRELKRAGVKNVDLYLDDKFKCQIPQSSRLIISPESLWKIDFIPDIIVVDEAESISQSFDGGYHGKHLDINRTIYELMMKNSKYALFMDAELTARTVRFVERFRNYIKVFVMYKKIKRNIHCINEDEICRRIIIDLYNGKKIVIARSTVSGSKKIYEYVLAIIKHFNLDIKIKLINSEQSDDPNFFDDINTEIVKYDVVIHTSTLGPGVSIDVEHFDRLYIMTSNAQKTASVFSVHQMTGRVRNYRENDFYWFHDQK